MTDYEKFEAVGKIRQFAANTPGMHPIGQKVRITGSQKSIDIDVAKYVQCGLKAQTVYKWLQFMKEVIAC